MSSSTNRRSFLKATALASGGFMLQFSWLASCQTIPEEELATLPKEWFELNGFLKIGDNGLITIMSPNPEGGQNIKTAMPMIVAEELDADWDKVIVEQAPLNTELYQRQFIGGSNAIRFGWQGLRQAGATARYMLMTAAAEQWEVPIEQIATDTGYVINNTTQERLSYGHLASAAKDIVIPDEITLKKQGEFSIIGSSRKNVDGLSIVTGKPLFGIDTYEEGMLTAMIVHPPAFGMKFKSMDDTSIRAMPGIRDVFKIKVLDDQFHRMHFDTCTFLEVVAIVGETTWQVMQAKKAIEINWEPFESYSEERTYWGREQQTITIPSGLESSNTHKDEMSKQASQNVTKVRMDGTPRNVFNSANKTIERTYTAPYLAHNCMEPMNFYADVTADRAVLKGPVQKAELTEQTLSSRLGLPIEDIDIQLTRLGGGYGRRSYAHWAIEAALISQKVSAPVKLVYTREDDMAGGIYRPAYQATYKAAINKQNELIGLHINAGGNLESPLYANRFPAGAIDHYLAESWTINSNITIGSFRAPRSNFIACAEQSFLDEIAEELGKDPIDLRIEMLQRSLDWPVGSTNDYDPKRYIGVLKLVREKSAWDTPTSGFHRGVSAYFCHNSYGAVVLDYSNDGDVMTIERVCCAIDCGIVVNPDAATNLCEGAIVDAIGVALYGELPFEQGKPMKSNFHEYRMIRMSEVPKTIDVHFVKSSIDPTGLGEPAFPPVFGALANAIYSATGQRLYDQPFMNHLVG